MATNDEGEFSLGTENNQENEFALGTTENNSEDGEFSLGIGQGDDADGFSLGDENSDASVAVENKDPLAPIDIEDLYKTFVEPYNNGTNDYSKPFESEIGIFNVFGLEKFVKFNENTESQIKQQIEERHKIYRDAAKDKWQGDGEFTQTEHFLNQAKDTIFRNIKSYRDKMRIPLWKRQCDVLYGKIDAYGDDKVISTSEYSNLLKQAAELGLNNFDASYKGSEEKSPEDLVEEYAKVKKGYTILTADIEFIEEVEKSFEKDERNKADTEKNRQRLFELYGKLKGNMGESATEDDMFALLAEKDKNLISKIEVFESIHKNELSGKLEAESYYNLKNSARGEFEFIEDEWNSFCEKHNIEKPKEQKPNFYIGKGKVESIEDIPSLMDANKEDVNINTIIGQLNGIGRSDLAQKIESAQDDYHDDKDAIFEKTKYILNSALTPHGFDSCDYLEIARELENNETHYREHLIGTKNSSLQLWLETRTDLGYEQGFDAEEVEQIKYAIVSDTASHEKRLNKVILSLEGNNFRIGNKEFKRPLDVVDDADDDTKREIANKLVNFNSKVFWWIEKKFTNLIENVKFWASNDWHNEITLSYALEEKAPFHYGAERINSLSEMESYILENIQSKDFLNALLEPKFLGQLDFWESKYQKSQILVSFIPILFSMAQDISYKDTFNDFLSFMESNYLSPDNFSYYFGNFIPLYNLALYNEIIDNSLYEEHKKHLYDFIYNNKNNETFESVRLFIESEISEIEMDANKSMDSSLLTELFKYHFDNNIDREYYENYIHPLLEKAIDMNLIADSIREEEKHFFVDKYVFELKNADYQTQCALFQSVEKLDNQNPVLLHYQQSKVAAIKSIKKENLYKTCSNFIRFNFVAFLTSLVFSVSLIACVLRYILPRYVQLDVLNNFLATTGILLKPLSFLISTQRGNFILAGVILLLFIKPLASMLFTMKGRIVSKTLYDSREDQDVINFVVSQIGTENKNKFERKSKYNVFSLIGRISFGLLTIVLVSGMFVLCFYSKFLFILLAIYIVMIFTQGDSYWDNKNKIYNGIPNKFTMKSLIVMDESAVNATFHRSLFISEMLIFTPIALSYGNHIMKIIGAIIWGIQILIMLPRIIKEFSIQNIVILASYIAGELFYWFLSVVFIYSALFVFVLEIANLIYSKIIYNKKHISDNLLDK